MEMEAAASTATSLSVSSKKNSSQLLKEESEHRLSPWFEELIAPLAHHFFPDGYYYYSHHDTDDDDDDDSARVMKKKSAIPLHAWPSAKYAVVGNNNKPAATTTRTIATSENNNSNNSNRRRRERGQAASSSTNNGRVVVSASAAWDALQALEDAVHESDNTTSNTKNYYFSDEDVRMLAILCQASLPHCRLSGVVTTSSLVVLVVAATTTTTGSSSSSSNNNSRPPVFCRLLRLLRPSYTVSSSRSSDASASCSTTSTTTLEAVIHALVSSLRNVAAASMMMMSNYSSSRSASVQTKVQASLEEQQHKIHQQCVSCFLQWLHLVLEQQQQQPTHHHARLTLQEPLLYQQIFTWALTTLSTSSAASVTCDAVRILMQITTPRHVTRHGYRRLCQCLRVRRRRLQQQQRERKGGKSSPLVSSLRALLHLYVQLNPTVVVVDDTNDDDDDDHQLLLYSSSSSYHYQDWFIFPDADWQAAFGSRRGPNYYSMAEDSVAAAAAAKLDEDNGDGDMTAPASHIATARKASSSSGARTASSSAAKVVVGRNRSNKRVKRNSTSVDAFLANLQQSLWTKSTASNFNDSKAAVTRASQAGSILHVTDIHELLENSEIPLHLGLRGCNGDDGRILVSNSSANKSDGRNNNGKQPPLTLLQQLLIRMPLLLWQAWHSPPSLRQQQQQLRGSANSSNHSASFLWPYRWTLLQSMAKFCQATNSNNPHVWMLHNQLAEFAVEQALPVWDGEICCSQDRGAAVTHPLCTLISYLAPTQSLVRTVGQPFERLLIHSTDDATRYAIIMCWARLLARWAGMVDWNSGTRSNTGTTNSKSTWTPGSQRHLLRRMVKWMDELMLRAFLGRDSEALRLAAVNFYSVVARDVVVGGKQGAGAVVAVPSSELVYRLLLSRNAPSIDGVCRLLMLYKTPHLQWKQQQHHLSNIDDDEDDTVHRETRVLLYNCFLSDFSAILWNGSGCPPPLSSKLSILFPNLRPSTQETLRGNKEVAQALTIERGAPFWKYHAPSDGCGDALAGEGDRKERLLEYLKSQGLDGLHSFIRTFISSSSRKCNHDTDNSNSNGT